jgi:RNA polymerase sigma-70 factor, ECF subfamily
MRAPTADEELVRALYEEHAGRCWPTWCACSAETGSGPRTSVQETLLRAWRNPRSLEPARGSVRPWLWTVARNLVVDGERARRARPQEVTENGTAMVPVDDGVDRALAAQVVLEALATLTPEHRAAVVETYYRGRSVAEAARSLAFPRAR